MAEIPKPRSMDQHRSRSLACKKPGCTAGGKRWVSEQKLRLHLQPLPRAGITSAPPQTVRREILTGAPAPGATKGGDRWDGVPLTISSEFLIL